MIVSRTLEFEACSNEVDWWGQCPQRPLCPEPLYRKGSWRPQSSTSEDVGTTGKKSNRQEPQRIIWRMAPKRIFSVGKDLPGGEFEYVPFESDRTLLDADIIMFWPMFGRWSCGSSMEGLESYQGKAVMSEYSSAEVPARLEHWRTELSAAANSGKLVIIYLEKPEDIYRDTGRRDFSGTGRNARETVMVEPIATYNSIPAKLVPTPRSGTVVQLTPAASIISAYWKEFGSISPYVTTLDGECGTVLLRTPGAPRTVGSVIRTAKGGALLFLPPISFERNKFLRFDKRDPAQAYWNADGQKFGKRLIAAVVGIAKTLSAGVTATPPPSWTDEPAFALAKETAIQVELESVAKKLKALTAKEQQLKTEKRAAGVLRNLLYEQGRPLETAILEALQLMGFAAEGFAGDGSEFDAVFTSSEGRCLGEAEGKDHKAINIDKLSQLERNIQEDFARDEVATHAKGVLFGNAYRLTRPTERGEYFTEKCVMGAKRAKIALVRTPDLFPIARYLRENSDPEFAAKCREAILATEGDVVLFPETPDAPSARRPVPTGNPTK